MIRRVLGIRRDESGLAAVEFSLIAGLLTVVLMSTAEVGRYAWSVSQVAAASQTAAYAALVNCELNETPVTLNCPDLGTAVTSALQGSALKSEVTLRSPVEEAWYCVNNSRKLQKVSTNLAVSPGNCADYGVDAAPALYLKVEAQYDYQPVFPGLTLAETFPDKVTRTAWMRVQ
jgi:Flp pilus assembly protein TadG